MARPSTGTNPVHPDANLVLLAGCVTGCRLGNPACATSSWTLNKRAIKALFMLNTNQVIAG